MSNTHERPIPTYISTTTTTTTTEVSLAGTEEGHLSAASICTPGHPYLFLYDVAR